MTEKRTERKREKVREGAESNGDFPYIL